MNKYLTYEEKEKILKQIKQTFSNAFVFADGLCLCKKNSIFEETDKMLEMDFIVGIDTNILDTYFIAHCVENDKFCYCFFSKTPFPRIYYVSLLEFFGKNIIDYGMYTTIKELLDSQFCQEVIECKKGVYLTNTQKEDYFKKANEIMYPENCCRICASGLTAIPNPYNNGWNYIDLLIGFIDEDYYSDIMIAHDIKSNKWILVAADNKKTDTACFVSLSFSDTIEDVISEL